MEHAPDGRLWVVCDTCVLINFLHVDRLDLLCRHPDYWIVITEHVRGSASAPPEITDQNQFDHLTETIKNGLIDEVQVTDPAELALFAKLNAFIGRGEAAAIAVAANRNWAIATDEGGRTRREIETRLGLQHLLTTPGVILNCVRAGVISVSEADAIKAALEKRRFRMNFDSFRSLLP